MTNHVKKIEGQAYFFRAFVYFNLIRSFGDVPYIDKPLNLTDVEDITRTPREEVYAKVMADFDKAIEYLPEEWDAANTPRVTKGAALAMKLELLCTIVTGKLQQMLLRL